MDRTEQPDATPVPPIPELEPEHTALRIETEQDGQGKLRRLSLQEMARIAEAVLDDPAMNAAGLAWQMGLSRITVALAAKKVREAGGWYTKIVWKTCIHCGEPLATSGSANGLGPSRYHARCREAHRWQMVKKNLARQSPLEAEERKRLRRQYEQELRRRKSSLSGGEHSSVGGRRSSRTDTRAAFCCPDKGYA
ncbi:MAG TPA: hypothetical protein VHS28_02495 [Chloroflexota bacterium]|nr:hypothetical protein [Chloroflexota bacterium]